MCRIDTLPPASGIENALGRAENDALVTSAPPRSLLHRFHPFRLRSLFQRQEVAYLSDTDQDTKPGRHR